MASPYAYIHVIINPAAGQDEPMLNILNRVFMEHEVFWDVSITHQYGDGAKHARDALAAGADLIASYGGDGTAVDVANGLIGSTVPQAILPGGTANALAQELGISLNLEEAVRGIFKSRVETIDLGQANDRYFMLRADMGATTKIMEGASREMKDRYGVLAYIMSVFQTATEADAIRLTLTLDGERVETEGIACLIANANKIGTLELTLSPDVSMTDGLLDVFVFNNVAESLLSAVSEVIRRQEGTATTLQHWQVREITIEADPQQPVSADGEEAFGETPITIKVVPQAMKVLVPAGV